MHGAKFKAPWSWDGLDDGIWVGDCDGWDGEGGDGGDGDHGSGLDPAPVTPSSPSQTMTTAELYQANAERLKRIRDDIRAGVRGPNKDKKGQG